VILTVILQHKFPIIFDYSGGSILLPFFIGLLSIRKHDERLYPLLFFLSIGVIMELLLILIKGNDIIYHNLYTVIEAFLIGILLCRLTTSKLIKNGILIVVLIYEILAMSNLFFLQGIWNWNTYSLMGECVIISIGCVAFLYDKIIREDTFLIINTDLLIVFSLLFYFTGSFMVFALGQYYVSGVKIFSFDLWIIHSVINISFNLFLSFALIYDRVLRR